ncbi:MAG: serine/threonine-protein kinase [Candidatus Acidiferrales bacterium]
MAVNPFNSAEVEAALGGRYTLGPELRTGGQGVVYRTMRTRDEAGNARKDDAALKIHLDPRQDERAEREIRAAKNISHPALADLLEDGVIQLRGNDVRYIAWGFIEGEPLDARIAKGALSERETAQIAYDVTSAVEVLWAHRIVHRDVAPKNIMLSLNGHAVLIDLGGARHLDNSTITATGATFGTVGYLSPEQCHGEHALTSASDVFALGVVMLECLLGRHPTNGDQHRLLSSDVPVAALIPNAFQETRQTIEAMLHQRAAFRPRLEQLSARLQTLLNVR